MTFTPRVHTLSFLFIFPLSSIVISQSNHKELFEKAKYTLERKSNNYYMKNLKSYDIKFEGGSYEDQFFNYFICTCSPVRHP